MEVLITVKKMAFVAILSALAVILSPINFPVGATKCFPAQHMVNAIAGIFLGPWYAVLIAIIVGTIRISLGLGTIFAYPGGIFGGLIVGLFYQYIRKSDLMSITEPIGTVGLGATVSALIVAPMIGSSMTLYTMWVAFATSSVPGSLLGFIIIKTLRRTGFDKYFN
ncbi:energy coupling factor transporter S component ThiW [Candidatus Bathyarchaeota archaeon]|nr:energy coupling factor transporter S component ThiW [Candidatus Bathyarchaeota archaeon]